MTDQQLITSIQQNNDEEALKQLIQTHAPVCYRIINNFIRRNMDVVYMFDDLFGDVPLIIYEAALSFDFKKKVKFSSWVSELVKYKCLRIVNVKIKGHYYDLSTDTIDYGVDNHNGGQQTDTSHIYNILSDMTDERMKTIFSMRFHDGHTWSNIGAHMGISTQTVINLYRKGKKYLRNKLLVDKQRVTR